MKYIIIGLVVIAALVGGFFLLNNYIYQEKQADVEQVTVSGVITAIDVQPMTYDAPGRVTIRTDAGEERLIEMPARGFGLCEAGPYTADAYALEIGDRVEVTGNVTPETGVIVPCDSVEHYLHATGSFTDPALGIQFSFRRGPDGYVLQVPPHGNEEEADFEELYILMLQRDFDTLATLEGAEGPPTINIAIFRNPKNQDPSVWAKANPSVSNIALATGEPMESIVSGANAIRYTVDGLYRMDTSVIADGGFIFVVSGAYLEEDSTIRRDFEPVLQSITFIPRPGEE